MTEKINDAMRPHIPDGYSTEKVYEGCIENIKHLCKKHNLDITEQMIAAMRRRVMEIEMHFRAHGNKGFGKYD